MKVIFLDFSTACGPFLTYDVCHWAPCLLPQPLPEYSLLPLRPLVVLFPFLNFLLSPYLLSRLLSLLFPHACSESFTSFDPVTSFLNWQVIIWNESILSIIIVLFQIADIEPFNYHKKKCKSI